MGNYIIYLYHRNIYLSHRNIYGQLNHIYLSECNIDIIIILIFIFIFMDNQIIFICPTAINICPTAIYIRLTAIYICPTAILNPHNPHYTRTAIFTLLINKSITAILKPLQYMSINKSFEMYSLMKTILVSHFLNAFRKLP